jgi:hypothetical protein
VKPIHKGSVLVFIQDYTNLYYMSGVTKNTLLFSLEQPLPILKNFEDKVTVAMMNTLDSVILKRTNRG